MSASDDIEAQRRALLAERRRDNPDLDERFGAGSFGAHEALHAANLLGRMVDTALCEHSAVLRDPDWYRLACEARESPLALYQKIGATHLAPSAGK